MIAKEEGEGVVEYHWTTNVRWKDRSHVVFFPVYIVNVAAMGVCLTMRFAIVLWQAPYIAEVQLLRSI